MIQILWAAAVPAGSRDDYHCKGAGWYKAQDGTTFPECHAFIHLQTTTVSSSWAQRVLDMVCYRLVPVPCDRYYCEAVSLCG